jgi:hypothetical protein
MDIQEAIHVLQDCGDAAKGTEFEQVYRMGAVALREQAECGQGCKYCRGEYNISTVSVARHTSDDETVMPIETLYCPHCGRYLGGQKDGR